MSGKEAFKSLNFAQNAEPVMSGNFDSVPRLPILKYFKSLETSRVYHRKFFSITDFEKNKTRGVIDEGLFVLFAEPKSFTGESILIFC